MLRDLKSHVDEVQSLAPAARTNGTSTGAGVDLRGFNGAVVVFAAGAWTDGSHTPQVQDSDDGTTFAAVDAGKLQGTFTAMSGTAQQNANQRVGYMGGKRYVRGMIVTATSTTGALSGVNVIRGHANQGPLA